MTAWRLRQPRRDTGAATLLVITCLALLMTIGVAMGAVAGLFGAHRSAQAAADLAALAGASARQRGADGCAAASRIAGANRATLTSCRHEGDDLVVSVVVAGPRWLGQGSDLVAEARAGPSH